MPPSPPRVPGLALPGTYIDTITFFTNKTIIDTEHLPITEQEEKHRESRLYF